ncbi:MAG: DUF1552 domain-containing protein [Rubripirellula sp.]|nr:DUF1552 domain-containing protein [Rubripirellula sp.]
MQSSRSFQIVVISPLIFVVFLLLQINERLTMTNRRNFLQAGMLGAGTGAVGVTRQLFASAADGKQPKRFIFIHKGNGLLPSTLAPPSLSQEDAEKEKRKEAFSVDLAAHDLPNWMQSLDDHKENLTILQGLSGKMCTTGHHTWQSSLGVYKANERLSSIKWATVDFELARLFPSPLEHIELACFPTGGGNSRGNINGIEKGFSARGPQQPNYAFGSPKIAMRELFKSVSNSESAKTQYQLNRLVLEFAAKQQLGLTGELTGLERAKVLNYANSIEDIRKRNRKVDEMSDSIRRCVPTLDSKYFADDVSTVDRQIGFSEILLATLMSGMVNVVTFTVDELGTPYTGVSDVENETINLHDVGHGKPVGRFQAEEVREKVRHHHMDLINTIVSRLKAVPEGDGNMFDNTMLLYFPDNGETHHSHGTEWPFIVLAGRNSKLDVAGKYVRLPAWGKSGHQTLGNWYTTILNAYGNPIPHYGDFDITLEADQSGPIRQFLG